MAFPVPAWCYQCKTYLDTSLKSESPFLCRDCFETLPSYEPSYCMKCGRLHNPLFCQTKWAKPITHLHVIFPYQDPLRGWISSLKYNLNLVAGRMLQIFVRDWFVKNEQAIQHLDLVLPIPLHFGRLNSRGFNQAVFLLNKQKTLPLDWKMLKKVKPSPQQAGKTREQRKANLKKVFTAKGSVQGKKILLFDDVCTTGQTLSEAAGTVKKLGARQVDALVLCRSLTLI